MRRRIAPPVETQTPTGPVQIGGLVRYYRDGWYYGHIEHIGGATVRIKPIGPKGSIPRAITVPVEDVRAT